MMNRTIGLDFDGGLYRYRNTDVGVDVAAHVASSGIAPERCNRLVAKLNRESAGNGVCFAVGSHADATIHIGKTNAFNQFGRFAGLAEGIGSGDAFVMLDDSASDDELLTVIHHEAGHMLGILDHGGMGLERYATVVNFIYNEDKPKSEYYGYDYYLSTVSTTNVTINDQFQPVGIYDNTIKLQALHDQRIIQYVWGLYDVDEGHRDTQYVTEDMVYDNYRYASDCEAYEIDIYGGYAMNCTANTIFISRQVEADTYVWQRSTYDTNNDEYSYSNYMITPGGAVECKADSLLIYGGGMAYDCAVSRYLYVMAEEFEPTGEILRGSINGGTMKSTDEDHGCTLEVDYGATAQNILMKKNPYSFIYTDWVYIGEYSFDEDDFRKFGYAEAIDLTVENGEVYVYKGGKLNGASIHGTLHAEEGAVLEGDIACTSVDLEGVIPDTNITIKVDLREYAKPFFEEWVDNTHIEYYANYKTITRVYDPESIQYFEWEGEYYPYYTDLLTVTNGYFDNKDGRFDMKDVKHSFDVDLGEVDAKSLSKIVIDFDGTDQYFDDGHFYFEYPHAPIATGEDEYEYIPFTEYNLPFQFKGDKNKYFVELSDGDIAFYYDSSLYGRTEEVLWLQNGEDAEYNITLAPIMKEAVGDGEIHSDEGTTTIAPLKGTTLTVKGNEVDGGNMTVKAEDSQHRDLTCEVDLIVVPEEMPIIGKKGAMAYSTWLRRVRKARKPSDVTSSVSAVLPCDFKTELLGMKFELSSLAANLTVNWTKPSITLKLQGKLDWDFGTEENPKKITIDLSGDNYFSVTHSNKKNEWILVGEIKVPDMKFGKFEFSDMGLKVNTAESSFTASASVQIPWIKYGFSGSIGIANGHLDSMALKVTGLSLPLGSTGLFVTSIGGGIEGIATSLNLTFTGNMGLTYGPTISIEWDCEWLGIDDGDYNLCEINLDSKISTKGDIFGKAAVTSLGGFIKGNGEVKAGGGSFSMKGEFTMLNDFISVSGELTSSDEGGVAITGVGKFQVPRHEHFGMFRGMGLSVNARANFSKRYIMAWESMTVFGNQISVGIKCSFEKKIKVTLLGASDLLNGGDLGTKTRGADSSNGLRGATTPSVSGIYTVVDDGTTLFQFNFTMSDAYASLSYDGTEYMQTDIAEGLYGNMQIVNELTSAYCVTIAVDNAALGDWTLNAYGDDDAEFGVYALLPGGAPEPVINGIVLGGDSRSATINYSLGDLSALENATLSVYRVEGDSMEYAGTLLDTIDATDATGVFQYDLPDELAGGDYAFYLSVESDNYAPAFSVISDAFAFRVLDDEAPDQIQRVNAVWRSSGTELTWNEPYDNTGVTGYTVRYSIDNEFGWYFDWNEVTTETASFTFDGLQNGMYAYQVTAYDASANKGVWSEEESELVLTTANAIYKNITITEDLELATYESAYKITMKAAKLTTAENSLVSASTIGDAEIAGILEDSTVNGTTTLLEDGNATDILVNGDFTIFGTADGVTVANGGRLTIENGGVGMNVTIEAGGSLMLMDGAEYDNVSVAYGASFIIPDSGVIRLEGDITTATPISHYCYINGGEHAIHFEQYKQTEELLKEGNAYYDRTALVTDLDKYLGNALDIVIDTASYGEFKIADAADYFMGGLSVTDHATGNSVLLDLDMPNALSNTFCTLHKDADGLWLNVHNPNEWDHKNITIGTGGDYQGTFKLEGQWAQNVTVVNNGKFTCDDGAVVDGLVIDDGGSNNANVTVGNAIVTNAILNNGTFNLNIGGHVTDIVVNGGSLVLEDGTLDDAFIGTNGRMEITQTGNPILTGTITVQGGVYLSNNHAPIETNAHFVFDLEGRNVNNDSYFISEGAVFTGNTTYSLLLPEHPEIGYYCITHISTDSPVFETFSITVTTSNGNVLGDLTINGDAIRSNGFEYSLYNQDATIYFNVNESSEPYEITTQEWDGADGTYIIEYSTDDFQTAVRARVDATAVDTFGMPSGDYQWRVRPQDSNEWTAEGTLTAKEEKNNEPKHIVSNDDSITDVFFAKPRGTWNGGFEAQHLGTFDGWRGTGEAVLLRDKNKLADIVEGSDGANVLLMTDDANGDALFVDDIYSALPGDIDEQQSRLAKINEIRAGAGDDVVDLTSQEFMYVGGGMTVRGGIGDDVIWANNGNNWLFGDAGNDRIVGAAGNDVISGGAGNDLLHGGGGNDIFAFGGDWGQDIVEQLADGKITLWFANGDESKWNESTLTYTDGDKSVKVIGSCENINLKFGVDGGSQFQNLQAAGAFDEFTSEKIFEDKNRGMLA